MSVDAVCMLASARRLGETNCPLRSMRSTKEGARRQSFSLLVQRMEIAVPVGGGSVVVQVVVRGGIK